MLLATEKVLREHPESMSTSSLPSPSPSPLVTQNVKRFKKINKQITFDRPHTLPLITDSYFLDAVYLLMNDHRSIPFNLNFKINFLVATFGPIPSITLVYLVKWTPIAHATQAPHARLTWEFVWWRDKPQMRCQLRQFDIERISMIKKYNNQ